MGLGPARRRKSSLFHNADIRRINIAWRVTRATHVRRIAMVIDLFLKKLNPALTNRLLLLHALLQLSLLSFFELILLEPLALDITEELFGALLCFVYISFPEFLQLCLSFLLVFEFAIQ